MVLTPIDAWIKEFIGTEFEIHCPEIRVHGERDHVPPHYKGPGVLKGKRQGYFEFLLYGQNVPQNSAEITQGARVFQQTDPGPCRFFATDYSGREWSGAWFVPRLASDGRTETLVSGELDQLSSHELNFAGEKAKVGTHLVFDDAPRLPLAGRARRQLEHGERVILTEHWQDHHELKVLGTKIQFQELGKGEKMQDHLWVFAEEAEELSMPFPEAWIPESLTVTEARFMSPRLVVRQQATRRLIFIRNTPTKRDRFIPKPISDRGAAASGYWRFFESYLTYCSRQQQYSDPTAAAKVALEVLSASQGTRHGLMLACSTAIEGLAALVNDELKLVQVDQAPIDALHAHLNNFSGDKSLARRLATALKGFRKPSARQVLTALQQQAVITKQHLQVWKKVRHPLAHGAVLNPEEDREVENLANTLIECYYCILGYLIGFRSEMNT